MTIQETIARQYHSTLKMLEKAIELFDEPLWLAASVVLLGIMGVCFVSAGRIAKKTRISAATTGAAKE